MGGAAGVSPLEREDDAERYVTRPVRPVVQILVRIGLWAAVGLGCVGGAFALLRPSDGGEGPVVEAAPDAGSVPAPVAGVAELAVEAWLTATEDDSDRLDALFVNRPDPRAADNEGVQVGQLTTVAGRQVGDGYWIVTVAAEVIETVDDQEQEEQDEDATPPDETPDEEEAGPRQTTWFVSVGIVGDVGGGLAALTTPGVIPASQTVDDGWGVALGEPRAAQSDDPLKLTVEAFLSALLAGRGEASRYLAPGVAIASADPPPFEEVVVEQLATQDVDESSVRVLVRARATTPGGAEQSLSYELVALARVDRWEISDFSAAPSARREPASDQQG